MAFRNATYKISSLHLDISNPRMRRAGNEAIAQENLLEGFGDSIVNLGKDIAANGLSPLEQWAVVRDGRKLVVLEGNRRLVACRLILDHTRTNNKSVADRFGRITATVPDERYTQVSAVVFDTRAEARHWIELKHYGAQDGAGVVKWGPEMVYLNARANGAKREKAGELWIYLEDLFGGDPVFTADLRQAREEQYTLLDRLVDVGLLDQLGLAWKHDVLHGSVGTAEKALLQRVFQDMVAKGDNRLSSRSINDVPSAAAYLDDVAKGIAEASSPFDDAMGAAAPGQVPSSQPSRIPTGNPPVSTPPFVVPKPPRAPAISTLLRGARFTGFTPRIRRLAAQGQKLKFNAQDELCGITLRVLLDLCTAQYWETCMTGEVEKHLEKRTIRILKHLDPNLDGQVERRAHPELSAAYGMCRSDQTDSGKLVRDLHDFIHNPHPTQGAPFAAAMSSALEPLFTLMSDAVRHSDAESVAAEPN